MTAGARAIRYLWRSWYSRGLSEYRSALRTTGSIVPLEEEPVEDAPELTEAMSRECGYEVDVTKAEI